MRSQGCLIRKNFPTLDQKWNQQGTYRTCDRRSWLSGQTEQKCLSPKLSPEPCWNKANKYIWHIQFYTKKWNTSQPHHYMSTSISRCTPSFSSPSGPFLHYLWYPFQHGLQQTSFIFKPCPTLDFHGDIVEASSELQLRKCLSFLTKFYLYLFTK